MSILFDKEVYKYLTFSVLSVYSCAMQIDHTQILPLLKEFAALSPVQQEIFLFCLVYCPRPRPHTGDLFMIRNAVGCKANTVHSALEDINSLPILSQLVKYTRLNTMEIKQDEYRKTTEDGICTPGADLQ